jgi:hypothetical protein
VSSDSATGISATLRFSNNSGVYALGGLAAVNDDFSQIGALHGCHGANPGFLRFERNVLLWLA